MVISWCWLKTTLKTELSKNFQEINLRNHLQMCSVSLCVKMLCLNSALPFGCVRAQVKDKVCSGTLYVDSEGEGDWPGLRFPYKFKKSGKSLFKVTCAFLMSHGSITSALQTVCLSLVQSCEIQEHSSNLVFSGTEVCLSQDSNEYSRNTFPLFIQL